MNDYLSSPLGSDSSNLDVPAPIKTGKTAYQLSPYLNYNPVYLPASQPEFIFPEGASRQRGRFELAFSQIGSSCMIGAALGGMAGTYNGLKATTLLGQTGKLRRTQMLNHIMKQGSATANTLGTIAVMYSGLGVLLSWLRGEDDEINTLGAATATGALYKSTAGLRKCAIGGGVGFSIAALYCIWTSRHAIQDIRRQYNPL
ncbi:mitochondrial import inner membrane translocase subunit Tim23-like [Ctenocephalides felis]|uniref:mitochondrial import inner membrane translocase subunit Tim23-like n=1 Tax=Ctenocephalides felis TaxID=7515 RepID=UPI000E6E2489|nr:mitochondrial import inner membrane translocase subunit Tim23-like [Ctenocephalides felis]